MISKKVEKLHSLAPEEPQPKRKNDTAMSFLLGTSSADANSNESEWKKEIALFNRGPQVHVDSNPLEWWNATVFYTSQDS